MAVGAVAITIEGVLQTHVGDAVIDSGRALYEGLVATFGVALITDLPEDEVKHWLGVNGFKDHSYLVLKELLDPESIAERRSLQVRRLKGFSVDVRMVIDGSPEVAQELFLDGVPTLLFLSPMYTRPEHRPDWDGSPPAWDDLVREVDRARELRAKDDRPTKEAL